MRELLKIFRHHHTDKGRYHRYDVPYTVLLGARRLEPLRLLEIGVAGGGSLRAWREYLPNAHIIGVDKSEQALEHAGERIEIYVGDQANSVQMANLADSCGPFDVVIDDGGHMTEAQHVAFDVLWPAVRKGGFYAIEDLHAGFSPKFNPSAAVTMLDRLLAEYRATVRGTRGYQPGAYYLFYKNLAAILKV